MIPYGRQEITDFDIAAVVNVLKSDFLTQGPVLPCFEERVCNHVGAKYGFAVNSATSALHIACLALGLGRADRLWTSPITFVASANCGLYCGAEVDFVDIDPQTFNLCPKLLEQKLLEAEKCNALPKVVVVVHLTGQSAQMAEIHELSLRFGFSIIEDASHAIGGKYQGDFVGCCRYSDVTVFSFHPVKIVTTAEGGLAVTNDPAIAERLELLRSHGITRNPALMTHPPDGPWYYQQIDLGYNYRMTDIQAALGLSQMERLDAYVARRNELAERYDELLSALPVVTPFQHPDSYSARHLYVIRVKENSTARSHREIFECLRNQGIGVNLHYIPVHIHPYYEGLGFRPGQFPNAEQYYREAISLPLFPTMSIEQQDEVIARLAEALQS
ncbi:UDP-4-amino-4,6-dideoxy-N-acetyl-beta-L-altrosamine transaminase [Marinobacter sp. 71-i]|uniref:UDP-4-amino-4, 6-dideoxy-N-acetyl-beta-L-altrosamine transaminase n=1 Tax=Marinobacter iranensis TaxID=2962607 RepID=A0ABT5YC67_9GAMM|nr:UDP-4-amino-4,6-dideoxy-N-acetyl-beta-L-altrosamine transaminase [Marinobacter iranensis]MDF0751265.1 UDP-4-amino-4,6-dideoxy-N-acetyl-beta-L-altrosamine transaminase [Marinobacter iranensis]